MPDKLPLPTLPEYVTIKEARQILGVSDKRVYRYIADGRLPAMRAGYATFLVDHAPTASLIAFLSTPLRTWLSEIHITKNVILVFAAQQYRLCSASNAKYAKFAMQHG